MSLTTRMDETRIDDHIDDLIDDRIDALLSRLVHLILTAEPILPPLDLIFRCVTR